jgi:hypothetical protein
MRQVLLAALVTLAGCTSPDMVRPTGGDGTPPVGEAEVRAGLKEALTVSVSRAIEELSRPGAMEAEPTLRLGFPPPAVPVEATLNASGKAVLTARVIESLNLAAETVAAQGKGPFLDAIKSTNIADTIHLMRGALNEATEYLRNRAHGRIVAAMRPLVQRALGPAGVTASWAEAMRAYGKFPKAERVDVDLVAYVTERVTDAIFRMMGAMEARIRQEPSARTTDLLRRVFGHGQIHNY